MGIYSRISKLPVNENTVARPRVDGLLQDGMQFPAVVVAAGAGFGKTQAVADFLDRSEYRSVWFQLTMLDNLPMRFWESFVYTVSLHRESMGEQMKSRGFPDSIYKYNKFLKLLAEELYADDRFVVFVFDDFQLLKDESISNFFKYFVSANLENICLLFITRELESYSFNTAVHVLTTEDLRFTREEAALYFEKRGIEIGSQTELEKIYSYTSGWPMALYLVGLQLKKKDLSGEDRFAGSRQMIFKLISKEIFAGYSEAEQKLFVLLSELNFFPQGLLVRVGEHAGVDAELLLQNNAFVSCDQKAHHYYLHQVFLDFLSEKRYTIEAEQKEDLLNRAAEWCVEYGYFADAIDYYDRCGRQDQVWGVIQGFEGLRHTRDEAEFFISYITKFPEGFMRENPMCRIVYAVLFLNNLKIGEAQQQMKLVHRQLEEAKDTPENRLLQGEACVAEGLISLGLENFDFVEWFKKAALLLPEGSRRWGKKLRMVEYSNALNLSGPEKGELEKSVKLFYEGMPTVSKVLHGAGYGLEYLAAAEAHFLTGDLKEAEKEAYRALYMAQNMEQLDIVDNSLFLLMRIFLVNGNVKGLADMLARLHEKEGHDDIRLQGVADIALGWFYSEIGEVSKVAGWILADRAGQESPISVDKEALLHIRCLLEEQNYYEALALSGKLEKIYQKRNTLISLIYAYVYCAVSYYQTDDMENAIRVVKDVYELVSGNNLIMPLIEYGHKTRAVLEYVRRQGGAGIPAEWLDAVTTKASTYAKRHSFIVSQFQSKEFDMQDFGLTQREIELLRNMSQGLTRDEIAASMYISPHTVKSMLKTVYNKIGAINSADAVRISIGAGLI